METLHDTPNLEAILSKLRENFETLYGPRLSKLLLFGSTARGDSTAESDIDVLVVLNGHVTAGEEIERTGEIVAGLSLAYNVVISCVFISAKRYAAEQSPFVFNVQRDGIPI